MARAQGNPTHRPPRRPKSDVIVVGAGPAGSTAAAMLARRGVRVLLVDREPFPRPKACGDVVPLGCFVALREIGLTDIHFPHFRISQVALQGEEGAERRFVLAPSPGLGTCVVPRSIFDEALFHHALTCGAEYRRLNVRGPILHGSQVVGVTGTGADQAVAQYGHVVIAADGATSAMARALCRDQRRDHEWAVALRAYVNTDTLLDDAIELAFLDAIQPGYAWFFPVANHRANVGVGMRSDFYRRQPHTLPALLTGYLSRPELATRIGRNAVEQPKAWPVPLFHFDKPRVFPGALLAGDAGGFVHPITAAGIYPAIITGLCAARATLDALAAGDLSQAGLAAYDAHWRQALADEFRPAVTASRLSTVFPHLVAAALLHEQPAGATNPPLKFDAPFAGGKF